MAGIFDILVTVDDGGVVRSAQACAEADSGCAAWTGLPLDQVPDAQWDLAAGTMVWQEQRFLVQEVRPEGGSRCLLLRRESDRERLLEAALDTVVDAVQVYDADAKIVYVNRACRQLLDLTPGQSIEGQDLLEIFAVDPEYSTTLAAMRTRSPVRGRFDVYKSTTGKNLSTVNASYPVVHNDQVLGTVSVERDMRMTETQLSALQQDQRTLTRHLSASMTKTPNIRYSLKDIIGSSPQLLSAVELATRMAPRDNNILIQGETGTGKEMFAQGIHALSSRRNEKFVAVNCAAFPETLIEGLLFGTVKGAFTGSTDKVGLMEEANHGTLFLDELNSMSLGMQAKLLRVLQEKTLQRVGGTKYIPIDIRVISTCNEDAYQMTENGKLRKDLFYRLASIMVEVPPLRERMEDLDQLVWHYIHRHEGACAQPITQIDPGFWRRLQGHNWPGNVRELFHILNYAVSVSEEGILRERDLPAYFRGLDHTVTAVSSRAAPLTDAASGTVSFQRGLPTLVREYEQHILREAYAACGKNATKTAELLKISRQNFQYYVKKYGLKE